MLQTFNNEISTTDQPLRFYGVELGARMTVIKLSDNKGLFVHSPIKPTDQIIEALKAMGEVKHIVAPNLLHHLFAGEFKEKFPEAKLYCAPGLDFKRGDIAFDEVIEEGKEYPWSEDLVHHVVQGFPMANEVVFCHLKSKTLLVTDLGIHVCEESPFLTRLLFKTMGMFKKYGWSKVEKWLLIKNKPLFNASITEIIDWDFDKIILSHGRSIKSDGKNVFIKAFL